MPLLFPSKIFLTGFMASGKTTLGRELAALTQRAFIDSDEEIEKHEGRSIPQIFFEQGENVFRKIEAEVLRQIAARNEPCIIALGGGAACNDENLGLILSSGYAVYIQVPVPVLVSRLEGEMQKRPLLSNIKPEELTSFIEKKLHERQPYYEKAHLMVNGINLGASLLFEIICAAVPQDYK